MTTTAAQTPIPALAERDRHQRRHPRVPRKADRPETVRQAQSWDSVKRRVMRLGLCEKCAAQYAWGCQIGFSLSHPPCPACQPIIDTTGNATKPNGWRQLSNRRWDTP